MDKYEIKKAEALLDIYKKENKHEDVISICDILIAQSTSTKNYYISKAMAFRKLCNFDKSDSIIEEAIEIFGNSALFIRLMADTAMDSSRFDLACIRFKMLRELYPEEEVGFRRGYVALMNIERIDEASVVLNQGLQLHKNNKIFIEFFIKSASIVHISANSDVFEEALREHTNDIELIIKYCNRCYDNFMYEYCITYIDNIQSRISAIDNYKLLNIYNKAMFQYHSIIDKLNKITYKNEKENICAIFSHNGFNDNVKYIYFYLLRNQYKYKFKFFWVTHAIKDYQILKSLNLPSILLDNSIKTIDFLLSVKVACFSTHIQLNNTQNAALDGAIKIQLWHGIPAKPVGFSCRILRKPMKSFCDFYYDCICYDYLIIDSSYIENIFQKFFPTVKTVICGSPRTDILCVDYKLDKYDYIALDNTIYLKAESYYELSKKIILLTPTFRELSMDQWGLQNIITWTVEAIQDLDVFLIIKLHPATSTEIKKFCSDYVLNFSNVEIVVGDIYPYIKLADIMITDYSSIYIDYLILNRKIIFLQPDFEYFSQKRGIIQYDNCEYHKIGQVVYTKQELINVLHGCTSFYFSEFKKNKQKFSKYGYDGRASERVVNLINNIICNN